MKGFPKLFKTSFVMFLLVCLVLGIYKRKTVTKSYKSYSYKLKQAVSPESCPINNIDWSNKIKPRYRLNPNKFILPTLYNGPINQLLGFHQAILVAITLNRTLILPQFYEHDAEQVTFRPLVDASHRIDVAKLRKLLSVIPLQQATKYCNGKLDAIFPTSANPIKPNIRRLWTIGTRVQIETGLQSINYTDKLTPVDFLNLRQHFYYHRKNETILSWTNGTRNLDWVDKMINKSNPFYGEIVPKPNVDITFENIQRVYKTNRKCALYTHPFRNFGFSPLSEKTMNSKQANIVLSNPVERWTTWEDGNLIYSEIFRYLIPPKTVVEFSRNFLENFVYTKSSKGFIAVHWRFDEEDFFAYMCQNRHKGNICKDILKAKNATKLAAVIIQKLTKISDKEVTAVYFAAPPKMSRFVEEIKNEFLNAARKKEVQKKIYGPKTETKQLHFLSLNDLKTFLLRNYESCDWLSGGRLWDTLSMIEMNICTHSTFFLYSKQSTWSKHILYKRKFTKYSEYSSVLNDALSISAEKYLN